ncbi:MAG: hypothetical protein AAFX07_13225 [Pseudomonadota bacterium]
MPHRGAGGTEGGTMEFLLGLAMMCGGGYLLLSRIIVQAPWGFGARIYSYGGYNMTTGMIFIPFMIGVGFLFYNSRNWIGWLLTLGSLLALIFGVIANLNVHLQRMSAFDLIVILVLLVGGLGLLLRSLRGARS